MALNKHDTILFRKYHLTDCTRCGNECAEACPVFRCYGTWHPQQLAHRFIEAGRRGIAGHQLLWDCVTCRACTEACPYDVVFADFIRDLRIGRTDYRPVREGLVHRFQRMQADAPRISKPTARSGTRSAAAAPPAVDRLSWIDGSLDVNRTRGIVLFVGCTPFFEAAFGDGCTVRPIESARSAVRILNRLGVSPVVLEEERCCGRDLYDIGDRETFSKLAGHNVALLKSRTIKTVLTLCPECAYTLGRTYAEQFGKLPFEIQHVTEFIARHIDKLSFEPTEERCAFQDPCYLARYLGSTEAPRAILAAVCGGAPIEMERHGATASCCCAGSWVNHGPHTRHAVDERFIEARRSGAEAIVTACPKCLLVFREVHPDCAWKRAPIAIEDLLSLAASRLRDSGG